MSFSDDYQWTPGIFRIGLDGVWTVGDLVSILQRIEASYHALNAIYLFSDWVQWERSFDSGHADQQGMGNRLTAHDMWFGIPRYTYAKTYEEQVIVSPAPPMETLVNISKNLSTNLHILSVSYASPGWFELIGNWNPLKALSDAINNWRTQNTIRRRDELNAELKREKNRLDAENERFRIQGNILRDILNAAPHLWSGGNNERLAEVNEKIVSPAMKLVEDMGRDGRIINAEIRPLDIDK